jgi:gamma-glutamyl hercynylcysteine S-oxide synthase
MMSKLSARLYQIRPMSPFAIEPGLAQLREMLLATRGRTLALSSDLSSDQLLGPRLAVVNPPLWEIGHLAWFQEYWCLRYRSDRDPGPSRIDRADELYNSAIIPHAERWDAPLLNFRATLDYLESVLADVLRRLEREGASEHLSYFVNLATFHEAMHCEALTYSRQTLGYTAPKGTCPGEHDVVAIDGDAAIGGGPFLLGAGSGEGFVFDNEKWAHLVELEPFDMSRTAVTNAQFAEFVDDGGYQHRALWSKAGWRWREEAGATSHVYWQKRDSVWHMRRYDRIEVLQSCVAVIHVNYYEAEAWCNWAQRRLPTEAEWEFAASTSPTETHKRRYPWGDSAPTFAHANLFGAGDQPCNVNAFAAGDSGWGVRQMFGNVWEWTADWFDAFPGFVPDPYKEYSEPWFGNHKVLRGGCYATNANLLRNTWRNFYTPERRDVLAGFRTCAL